VLVLKRRPGESIIIDGNIEITILPPDDASVRVGITAPAEILVLRKELLKYIRDNEGNK